MVEQLIIYDYLTVRILLCILKHKIIVEGA